MLVRPCLQSYMLDRLQHYANQELADVQAGFKKGRGARDQSDNIRWITEKSREFQKNIYLCFIDYTEAFDYVNHNKLWKALREKEIPEHLTCLLRNLYVGQEATVRTLYGTTHWLSCPGPISHCVCATYPCGDKVKNASACLKVTSPSLGTLACGCKVEKRI